MKVMGCSYNQLVSHNGERFMHIPTCCADGDCNWLWDIDLGDWKQKTKISTLQTLYIYFQASWSKTEHTDVSWSTDVDPKLKECTHIRLQVVIQLHDLIVSPQNLRAWNCIQTVPCSLAKTWKHRAPCCTLFVELASAFAYWFRINSSKYNSIFCKRSFPVTSKLQIQAKDHHVAKASG